MRRAVADSSIHVSMWFTSRSYPPFIALRQAILDGALGTIASLISTHPHKIRRDTAPAWYFDPNQYTGAFHDLACHGVDQIRWLTNAECVGVHALTTCKRFTDEPRLDDHVQASFALSDGGVSNPYRRLAHAPSRAFVWRHSFHHHGHGRLGALCVPMPTTTCSSPLTRATRTHPICPQTKAVHSSPT